MFFFVVTAVIIPKIYPQVLPTGGLHRGGNGHYLPAARSGDASLVVTARFSWHLGADSTGYTGVSRGSAGLRWYSFHRSQPSAADQSFADLELAAALLRELHDQQSLLQ